MGGSNLNHINPTQTFGGGSTMIMSKISMRQCTDLVILPPSGLTAIHYINEIVRSHVIPMRQRMDHIFILIENNPRPHVARVTRDDMEENNIGLIHL